MVTQKSAAAPLVLTAVVFIIFGMLTEAPCATINYYVSPSGSDSNPGTSALPWKTLQYAADHVGAGAFVTVREGNYAGFQLTADGSASAPIEFFAEPGVLINAGNPRRPDHGINLEDASYAIIDGFEVSGMTRAGVRTVGVDGSDFATNVTIRNVRSHDNGYWGILTGFVNNLLIENNTTYGSKNEHGIYVSNSGDNPIIRNNTSYNNAANGIHMNGDIEQGGDGIISNALVSRNVIYGNGVKGGSGINMDGVQNSRIENNLIYDNHASGISLYQIDGGAASTNNVVVNNTVYQAANARWALNVRDASTHNTVRNNIFLNIGPRGSMSVDADSLPGFTSDYNMVLSKFTTDDGDTIKTLAQWRTATGQDMHSIIATAAQLFVNPASDFHLLATAPAVNAGTASFAPTVDIAGNARPVGAAFDVGAYEFGAGTLTGDFNHDGRVDTKDYVLWRKTGGSALSYQQWRQHFGDSSGGGSAIPEPDAVVLMYVGMLVAATTRGVTPIPTRPKVPATPPRAEPARP